MSKKNHILDALSEVHVLVDGFPHGVEHLLEQYNDRESHTKKEAREIACGHIDAMVDELNRVKEELQRKYR